MSSCLRWPQNFYAKAAVLVLDSRIKVKITRGANGMRKPNKWVRPRVGNTEDLADQV